MPIIGVEIMKTKDETELQKKNEKQMKNKQREKEARGTEAIVKG